MTQEQIRAAVRAMIKTSLSLPDAQVLVDYSGGTVPAGTSAFVSIHIIDGSAVDHQTLRVADGDGSTEVVVTSQRRVRISVTGYGHGAEEWLTTLALIWWSTHPTMTAVRTAGLTPGHPGTVRALWVIEGGYQTPRYQVDLEGYHRVTLTPASVGTIDEIAVTQTMGGAEIEYTATAEG